MMSGGRHETPEPRIPRIKRVFPTDSYQDFRVFSRDAKVLVRKESSVSGGESTPGRRSTEGRRERLNYIRLRAAWGLFRRAVDRRRRRPHVFMLRGSKTRLWRVPLGPGQLTCGGPATAGQTKRPAVYCTLQTANAARSASIGSALGRNSCATKPSYPVSAIARQMAE